MQVTFLLPGRGTMVDDGMSGDCIFLKVVVYVAIVSGAVYQY